MDEPLIHPRRYLPIVALHLAWWLSLPFFRSHYVPWLIAYAGSVAFFHYRRHRTGRRAKPR